nr:MAG TPA: hypothetical protein [Caudoviricetes sp.]
MLHECGALFVYARISKDGGEYVAWRRGMRI